ncbi:tautomerase family protein [Delftia acidovorans]|uniref:tautomerase family protein n=1 Tax=Delftia acidovorans TaxID=80866 RepID=UPI00384C4D4B
MSSCWPRPWWIRPWRHRTRNRCLVPRARLGLSGTSTHKRHAFSGEDKQAVDRCITGIYSKLPNLDVGVVLETLAKACCFIGGQPIDDFVRIAADPIVPHIQEEATEPRFLSAAANFTCPPSPTRSNLRSAQPGGPPCGKWRQDNRTSAFDWPPQRPVVLAALSCFI